MFFKLNVDISFVSFDCPIGIGFLLRDSKGLFIAAGTSVGYGGSSEEGECSGLLVGAQWAKQQLWKLILETDNKGEAYALQGHPSNLSWMSYITIHETISNFKFFDVIIVKHCNRSGNYAAHILSKHADKSNMVSTVYCVPPVLLRSQLADDILLCKLNSV
ncbi:hypothetical protein FRX31_029792 [Thalictrum thalictroides]|uniref:RNase H type-1 domain-containing protein n=1 Tax=Thalictrum thalictroides TaxID=46969 RepID=A0A7J6V7Q2_THATH|nr:hypothetical protein FRX31_029792 [Thalictrum thalictroides]